MLLFADLSRLFKIRFYYQLFFSERAIILLQATAELQEEALRQSREAAAAAAELSLRAAQLVAAQGRAAGLNDELTRANRKLAEAESLRLDCERSLRADCAIEVPDLSQEYALKQA